MQVLILDDEDGDMIRAMMEDTGATSTQQLLYEMVTAYRWMINVKKSLGWVAKIDPVEDDQVSFESYEHPGLNRVRPNVH